MLLIFVDTLRADRLHCYGYPAETSPAIDGLAASGTLYELNVSQGSWTLPSMSSFMTGLYIGEDVPRDFGSVPLMAEQLAEAGLRTGAFVANPVLTKERGYDRGFETYALLKRSRTNGVEAVRLAERALDWAEDVWASEDSWFLWVHFFDPHLPYTVRGEDGLAHVESGWVRPDTERLMPRWSEAAAQVSGFDSRAGAGNADAWTFKEMVEDMQLRSNLYDGEVADADDGVALLLEALERTGRRDKTLIVFAADHGEMLWEYERSPGEIPPLAERAGGWFEHGLVDYLTYGHKSWHYPQQWRTPLIVSGPGFEPGRRVTRLTANLDAAATILDTFGVVPILPHEGRPLHELDVVPRQHAFSSGEGVTALLDANRIQYELHPGWHDSARSRGREYVRRFDWNGDWLTLEDDFANLPVPPAFVLQRFTDWRRSLRTDEVFGAPSTDRELLRDLGYLDEQAPHDQARPRSLDAGEGNEKEDG